MRRGVENHLCHGHTFESQTISDRAGIISSLPGSAALPSIASAVSMTQIQEFTLAFVPKVVAVGVALVVSGNWMLHTMVSYTEQLWTHIPDLLA